MTKARPGGLVTWRLIMAWTNLQEDIKAEFSSEAREFERQGVLETLRAKLLAEHKEKYPAKYARQRAKRLEYQRAYDKKNEAVRKAKNKARYWARKAGKRL